MKLINAILVVVVIIGSIGLGTAEGKSYPTDTEVELTGTVKQGAGYDADNNREEYFFLYLDRAISVDADEFGEKESHVREIQIVPLSGVTISQFLGKKISIKGNLLHAHSAHHYTKVLLVVGRSDAARVVGTVGDRRE